jgi:hypothetical protein
MLMKNFITVLLMSMFFLSATSFGADNTLTDAEKKEGWSLLFDGKTMSQWKNFKKDDINSKWMVKDGAMVLTGRGGGDLMTRKEYKNFDFKMEWMISEGGNSGIFILADEKGKKIYLHAPEIQILDNEKHSDRKKMNHRSGSLYDMITAPAESQKKAGEWNNVRILLKDRKLTIYQNDVKTAEVTIDSSEWKELVRKSKFKNWKGFAANMSGALGLQDHGNVVSFKNMKIKVLD